MKQRNSLRARELMLGGARVTTTVAAFVSGAFTIFALAQPTDSMKCAAFTGMEPKAQMAAIDSIVGLMPPDGRMSADQTGPGNMAGAMSTEAVLKRVSRYCRDHPDMMIGDAMAKPMQPD